MRFDYADYFEGQPRTGDETLLYDCMSGDQTLFQRYDIVAAGWSAIQPILDAWAAARVAELPRYERGAPVQPKPTR